MAVDKHMRKVIEVALSLNAPTLPHCMARVHSTAREDLVNLNLEGATGGDVRIQPEESLGDDQVPKDLRFTSLSQLIHDHCLCNPGDVNVVEYLRHRNARAANKDIRSKRPMAPAAWVAENPPQTYEVAKTNIDRDVRHSVGMVFSTCDSADRLKERGFKATVVFLDEASTITIPAALVPLTDQAIIRDRVDTGIKLLVIVGDPKQLDPQSPRTLDRIPMPPPSASLS